MGRPIRTLLFSTLYPSSVRPVHGIFVETRLRELLRTGAVRTKVVAPVPWFPSSHPRFGEYARMAATPAREQRNGIDVLHPRYPLIPKLGMTLAPLLLAAASVRPIQKLLGEGFDFDVIDAHYFYPDGVAAALLGAWFRRPVTITARGSDVNLIAQYSVPKRLMQWAARRVGAVIGVSEALTKAIDGWNSTPQRLTTIRNGVDLERFHPAPQQLLRDELGIRSGPVLLSTGNLVELKGHHLAIQAMLRVLAAHPGARLLIIGEGPERARLEALIQSLGLGDQVQLVGAVPNDGLWRWYGAADVSILASSREGWPNVLLESMACGTPVVATRVGGIPEIIGQPSVGEIIDHRDANAVAAGVLSLISRSPDRQAIRRYAEDFGWDFTSTAQLALFDDIQSGQR